MDGGREPRLDWRDMRPLDIQPIGEELAIKWDDGSESFVPLRSSDGIVPVPVVRGKWM